MPPPVSCATWRQNQASSPVGGPSQATNLIRKPALAMAQPAWMTELGPPVILSGPMLGSSTFSVAGAAGSRVAWTGLMSG